MLIVASFGPLDLFETSGTAGRAFAVLLLIALFVLAYLLKIKTVLVVLAALIVTRTMLSPLARRWIPVLVVTFVIIACSFVNTLSVRKVLQDVESVQYRLETVPFSLYVAMRHPLFGLGVWAPREDLAKEAPLHFMELGRFCHYVRIVRTADVLYVTIMADLGFPALVVYVAMLVGLFGRLAGPGVRGEWGLGFSSRALLMTLGACHLHFFTYDGLYHPHIAWAVFMLWGLVPRPDDDGALRLSPDGDTPAC